MAAEPVLVAGRAAIRLPRRTRSAGFGWMVVAITVGAVGLSAIAGPAAGHAPAAGLAWLLFVGSSVHVSATLSLFSFAEVRDHARREPTRYIVAPLGLLLASVSAWLVLSQPAKAPLLLAFFGWQLWHYQKQNLGITALAASAALMPSPSKRERRCIAGSGVVALAALFAHPDVVQLVAWRPPAAIARTLFDGAALLFGLCIAAAVACLADRWHNGTTTLSWAAAYLSAVAFPLPMLITRSPYAAIGGLTLAHGLQYLLLVGNVVAGPAGRRRHADPARLTGLVSVIIVAGGILAAASHLHTSGRVVGKIGFGAYLAVVMTHFVVDAGLWRLRDPFPRRWLGGRIPQLLRCPG